MSKTRRLLAASLILLGSVPARSQPAARTAGAMPLAMVAPVRGCAELARAELGPITGSAVRIASATLLDTAAGPFCKVSGTVAPAIGFEVDLPVGRWTQRFVQIGCGGLCGAISVAIGQAGGCAPALHGEFVVAATDMGYEGGPGQPLGSFAADPQARIDFAYRANHATALVAKALTKAFYGQEPRFSYFSGCSDGGREALMEAQRYPDDFDGVSAGAPAMNFQVQNSFYHAWVVAANRRANGTPILLAAKLPALHAAVIAHCDALDGMTDGLLVDPRACAADPAWVACPDATDDAACLTVEEQAVVRRIYDGPHDPASGRSFLVGGPQPGSELQWDFIPAAAGGRSMSAMLGEAMRRSMIYPQSPAPDALVDGFAFDAASFARVTVLHPLNDATDPDLAPFARHGGKLILWHGWSDTSISPMTSIAYDKAVQRQIGAAAADRVLRLFLLPGTGHCGGGDGFSQVDTLTPLMAWVEAGEPPDRLLAGKVVDRSKGPRGGLPGGGRREVQPPLAVPQQVAEATRPVFPFPAIPHPAPDGGYVAGPSTVAEPARVDWYGAELFTPGFQRSYRVQDGALKDVSRP